MKPQKGIISATTWVCLPKTSSSAIGAAVKTALTVGDRNRPNRDAGRRRGGVPSLRRVLLVFAGVAAVLVGGRCCIGSNPARVRR